MKNTKWTHYWFIRDIDTDVISTNTYCSHGYNKRSITLFSRVAKLCYCLAADYLFVRDYSPGRPRPEPPPPRKSYLHPGVNLVHDSRVVYDCLSLMISGPSSSVAHCGDSASSVLNWSAADGSCAFGWLRYIADCIANSPAGRGRASCYSYCCRTKCSVIPLTKGSWNCLCDCGRCSWTCLKLAGRPVRATRAANCCR